MEPTPRKGIPHIETMQKNDLLRMLFSMNSFGNLPGFTPHIQLKIDGFGLRYGLDEHDRFFIESSRSGPQHKHGSFSEYAIQKYGQSNEIADAYDHIFDMMLNDARLQKFLSLNKYAFRSHRGIKFVAECLYNPLGTIQPNGSIRFIKTDYDMGKLGHMMTIVNHAVIGNNDFGGFDGAIQPNVQMFLINSIKRLNNERAIYSDPFIRQKPIKITKPFSEFIESINKIKVDDMPSFILQSRKHRHNEVKQELYDLMLEYGNSFAKDIFDSVNDYKFGDEVEGIVCTVADTFKFKVISDTFRGR